ncbi:MAG: AAA family ATPase [Akkermansia sp.]|nr:AAA family ATPase [Akkermansia sp.]
MLQRKIDTCLQDYYKKSRNALLITGARQIGKTYSIRKFGESYKSFVEINFVEMPEAAAVIKSAKNGTASKKSRNDGLRCANHQELW